MHVGVHNIHARALRTCYTYRCTPEPERRQPNPRALFHYYEASSLSSSLILSRRFFHVYNVYMRALHLRPTQYTARARALELISLVAKEPTAQRGYKGSTRKSEREKLTLAVIHYTGKLLTLDVIQLFPAILVYITIPFFLP